MAHVVARANGAFEIRESHSTASGPRSRTLASFRTLTPEVIAKASAKAAKPLDAEQLRRAAKRKGAPVQDAPADAAAAELIKQLGEGHQPRPPLLALLRDALSGTASRVSSNAAAAAAWVGSTPRHRSEALFDLLLLVDSLPAPRKQTQRGEAGRRRFPRIESRPA